MKNAIIGAIVGLLIGLLILFLFTQKGYRLEIKKAVKEGVTPTFSIVPSISPTTPFNPTITITTLISPTTPPADDPHSFWLIYKNETYQYQFKYDPSWFLNKSNPLSIIVQGDVSQKGWPSISIVKTTFSAGSIDDLKNQVEALFETTTSKVTLGNNIPAVLMETAASPQAYATQTYYFIHKGNILNISLNDTTAPETKPIYQNFLDNFQTY